MLLGVVAGLVAAAILLVGYHVILGEPVSVNMAVMFVVAMMIANVTAQLGWSLIATGAATACAVAVAMTLLSGTVTSAMITLVVAVLLTGTGTVLGQRQAEQVRVPQRNQHER